MAKKQEPTPPPSVSFHRDDDKKVQPISQMIRINYPQPAPDPDLDLEICLAFVDEEPCVAIAVLEAGKARPEQYQVSLRSVVDTLLAGRSQMRLKLDPPSETKTKGGIILPPGVGGNGDGK